MSGDAALPDRPVLRHRPAGERRDVGDDGRGHLALSPQVRVVARAQVVGLVVDRRQMRHGVQIRVSERPDRRPQVVVVGVAVLWQNFVNSYQIYKKDREAVKNQI